MLNNVKVEIKKGGDFEPVPMDRYTCMVTDVNLVSQFNQFQGKEEDVLNYQFQILDDKEMPTKDGEAATTRGRYLWKRCRPAFNNRSWLGKLAKAAMGRDLTSAEIDAFDPESVVGKQVDVMVEQSESKDGQKIFNNIVAFNKTVKALQAVEATKETGQVVEKTTQPATVAPGAEEAESFLDSVNAATPTEQKPAVVDEGEEEMTPEEIADMEAKLAKAKKKTAAVKK